MIHKPTRDGALTKWASLSHPLKSMFTMARYPKASTTSSGMKRSGISRSSDTLPTRMLSSTSYHESTASTFSNRYILYIQERRNRPSCIFMTFSVTINLCSSNTYIIFYEFINLYSYYSYLCARNVT